MELSPGKKRREDQLRGRALTFALMLLTLAGQAHAADFSPIHGYWGPVERPCHKSDEYWHINGKGASPFDVVCTLDKVSRKGNTFTLTQQCNTEGTIDLMIVDIKRVSSKKLEIYGMPYKRCPRPS